MPRAETSAHRSRARKLLLGDPRKWTDATFADRAEDIERLLNVLSGDALQLARI
jgi:hypothetical protein